MINTIFIKICLVCLECISSIYFAYQYYQNSKPVITIYADALPIKIKPSEIEDIILSEVHSTIYETLISKDIHRKIVKLLPEPEKPVIINSRNQNDDPFDIDSTDEISTLLALIEPTCNSPNKVSYKQIEPKKNETGLNIIKLDKKSNNNRSSVKSSSNLDSYKVQLGSVKSESEAIQEGERIKKKFPKILKDAVITTQKVKYDDGKFFYLILAGNYDNYDKRLAETKYCVKHEDVWDLASSPSLRATERSVAIYKNNKKC